MTDDERSSQLSAMFDGELPPAECELLARRLARDEGLRRQWSSYALIGAAVRGEPIAARGITGPRVDVAARVRAALVDAGPDADAGDGAADGHSGTMTGRAPAPQLPRWAVPLSGFGLAAGVAAAALLWLRTDTPATSAVANVANAVRPGPAPELVIPAPLSTQAVTGSPGAKMPPAADAGYTVPPPAEGTDPLVGGATLATFLVAHSEVSMPLLRRNSLSAVVVDPAAADTVPPAVVMDGAAR